MRQPNYEGGETIDDVADEAHDRAVQEKLDAEPAVTTRECAYYHGQPCPEACAGRGTCLEAA